MDESLPGDNEKTLNPGNTATTERIVKQVKEILNRYSVDGIHFDDYFYTSEKKYNKVKKEERMEHVNDLIHKVHKAARKKEKYLVSVLPGILHIVKR